ncbi:MAG: hypothetical protein ABJN04_14570 [Hyphomicrobiales bacterium]
MIDWEYIRGHISGHRVLEVEEGVKVRRMIYPLTNSENSQEAHAAEAFVNCMIAWERFRIENNESALPAARDQLLKSFNKLEALNAN